MMINFRTHVMNLADNNLDAIHADGSRNFASYDLDHQNFIYGNYNEPSLQYEEIRRQIKSDIQEIG